MAFGHLVSCASGLWLHTSCGPRCDLYQMLQSKSPVCGGGAWETLEVSAKAQHPRLVTQIFELQTCQGPASRRHTKHFSFIPWGQNGQSLCQHLTTWLNCLCNISMEWRLWGKSRTDHHAKTVLDLQRRRHNKANYPKICGANTEQLSTGSRSKTLKRIISPSCKWDAEKD